MNDLPAVLTDPFEDWLAERHRWLQTAAADLLSKKRLPSDDELVELAELCHQEATVTESATRKYREIPKGLYGQVSARPVLRINRLFDVQGVAAIRQGALLDFTEHDLCIVYGPNGTGKTGFSRVLKQICGAKVKEDIHPNIFQPGAEQSSAKVNFSIGDAIQTYDWSVASGSCTALRQVQVFDSKTASIYAFSKSAPSFEPSRIRFISSLIRICDSVSVKLENKLNAQITKLPVIPPEFAATTTGRWISKLSPITREELINENCEYSGAHKEERLTLETTLAQKDIAGRLNSIAAERLTFSKLQQLSTQMKAAFSDDKCKDITQARTQARQKRAAAAVDANRVFAESNVEGVGTPSWRLFWEQAKKYSTGAAYVGKDFPNIGPDAACLLCHRELDEDARNRLAHFESFIRSGLEADAKSAESTLQNKVEAVINIPELDQFSLQLAAIRQPEVVITLHRELTTRREFFMTADRIDGAPKVNWQAFESILTAQLTRLDVEENSLKAAQDDGGRQAMVAKVLELRGREWASQNKNAIIGEVQRLEVVAGLKKAVALTKTVSLTKKSNELAELEIEMGYQDRFAKELDKLGGKRLNVVPQCKKEGKGKIAFGIFLKDAKIPVQAENVLSEGEARIVALAAFLADITGHSQSTTFVFDDPISSLDQDFEERVVTRLVELASERQVIVFTHRLSLLSLIEEAIKKTEKKAEALKRAAPISMSIQTLRRMDKSTGILVPHRLRDQKPKNAISLFQKDLIPEAKKLLDAFDPSYERHVASICSDLRVLVESTVETTLLNEVVIRFRRSVTTQGRIAKLAKISEHDCDFFDDLMTRYSVFEHSQSDELAAPIPQLDQIVEDVNRLGDWIKEFDQRAA